MRFNPFALEDLTDVVARNPHLPGWLRVHRRHDGGGMGFCPHCKECHPCPTFSEAKLYVTHRDRPAPRPPE
jgi:hypothetical protein